MAHIRPEKHGHYPSVALLGAVSHETDLKRKYLITGITKGGQCESYSGFRNQTDAG